MNRIHLHIKSRDLDRSVAFYSALLGAAPTVLKDDYAKWRLDDPAVNLAVSTGGCGLDEGVTHVGVEADEEAQLGAISARLEAAREKVHHQAATECCYARSEKYWARDPSGVNWEMFRSYGDSAVYGEDAAKAELEAAALECCA